MLTGEVVAEGGQPLPTVDAAEQPPSRAEHVGHERALGAGQLGGSGSNWCGYAKARSAQVMAVLHSD